MHAISRNATLSRYRSLDSIAGQQNFKLAESSHEDEHADRARMPFIDDGFEALLEPFYNGKKLTDPISTKEDKYQLLPAFLKVKGKQPSVLSCGRPGPEHHLLTRLFFVLLV